MLSITVIIFAFFNVNFVLGQSISYGKLTGKVLLASGEAVAGAQVEITSSALVSGKRTAVTNEKGNFTFMDLPIGKYKVRAILDSYKIAERKNITVSAATVTTVNLSLEQGDITEVVAVSGTPPIVDVRTSTTDTKINKELLEKLPTSREPFYDLSITTPGMFDVGKDSSWLPSPAAYGGSTDTNVFLVNGVNTTNPRGASWGSLVKVNFNAIEEVRVVALGSKAEYGSFSGVAIDVLTKSGSNTIHGNVGYYSLVGDPKNNVPGPNDDLNRDWLQNTSEADKNNIFSNAVTDREYNFTLGGPLVKNKVWFFTAFDYINADKHEPNFELTKDFLGRYFDLKLTTEPRKNHRAWIAYHFEKNQNDNTTWGSLNWDTSMVYTTKSTNHTVSSQWQWYPGSAVAFSIKYLGFWTDDNIYLPDDAPDHPGYINWYKWIPSDMGINGSFHYIEAQKSSRNTVQADVSHYAEDFLGEHDMKFGVQFTRGRGNWFGGYFHGYANYAYPTRWTQSVNYMQSWYGDTGLDMYVRQEHRNPYLTIRTADSLGFFLDDQWTIGRNLTFNIGLRYDRMTAKFADGGKIYAMPQPGVDVNNLDVLRERTGSDNVFDFKTFSPRLGLTYMLTKDAKTVFRASFGRYYSPISIENLGNTGPDLDATQTHMMFYSIPFDQADLDGDGYISGDEVVAATRLLHNLTPYNDYWTTNDPSWNLKVADDLKDQHTDQFSVSLERELFKDFSVNATYIHKNTKNIIVRWPINEVTQQDWEYERKEYTTNQGKTVNLWGIVHKDYNGDGAVDGGDVQWISDHQDFYWRNMPEVEGKKPRRLYQGFQLVLQKRYSNRWQMLASLLFSKSDGFASRSKRQDFVIEGPNITNDAWLGGLNQTINNMEGPLPFTPKFEFKLSGSYRIPKIELDLGFRFRYSSGRAIWPLDSVPTIAPWGGTGVITSGEAFLVAIDPTKPFWYPPHKVLDLHVERAFNIGPGSVRLMLDLFNVFNDGTVTNALWAGAAFGQVVGVTYPSRMLKLSLLFEY